MVTAALDIQRGEVESARPGRAEEEVAQAPDELCVDFLGFVRGEVFQQGIRADRVQHRGIEKGLRKLKGLLDFVAIVIHNFHVVVDERMADTVGRCGELGRYTGVDIRFVAIIGTQSFGAE